MNHICTLQTQVKDSRVRKDGSVRRRRKCLICGDTWSTVEVPSEEYDRLKAQAGESKDDPKVAWAFRNLATSLGFIVQR